jgi:hypothetical protein
LFRLFCEKVYAFLGRFVSYPSDHAHVAHSLWCLHTHLMDRWDSTPRLAFLSAEPASGKTRALEITELLVPSPVAAVNVETEEIPAYAAVAMGGLGWLPDTILSRSVIIRMRRRSYRVPHSGRQPLLCDDLH